MASDAAATAIRLDATVPTSVKVLGGVPRPASVPDAARVAPVENRVYVIDATLTSYRFDEDANYRLILKDSSGNALNVAIPHPDCVPTASPFKAYITASRAAIDARYQTGTIAKTTTVQVRVYGVGLFDSGSARAGAALNGAELHPVLRIEFEPTGAQGATPPFLIASNRDRIFDWAEMTYPELFPAPASTGSQAPYVYRYYSKTRTYLGEAGGRVILHNGSTWVLYDAGPLSTFISPASSSGF